MSSSSVVRQKNGNISADTTAIPSTGQLCVSCTAMIKAIQDLGASNILYGKKTPIWTTSEPLQCEQCVLCAHILARIPDAGQKVIKKYQDRRSSRIPFKRPKPATITFSVRKSPDLGKGQHQGFELSWEHQLKYGSARDVPLELKFTDAGGRWFTELESQLEKRRKDVGASTFSEQTWDTANQWLRECTAHHSSCRRSTYIPTRLIDVGPDHEYVVRLCERADILANASCVTLSHCWADSIPWKAQLRLDNLQSLRSRIDVNDLPKTFTNAITTTRKLGLRYLWIDSLCILQNSAEDWRHESRTMGDVYSNGYCNLAATASSDSAGGLFRDRNPLVAQNWRVDITVAGKIYPFHLLDYDLWQRGVDGAHLNGRGWVYQERFLSPRTLHYGQDQIFWECREKAACELYPGLTNYQIGRTMAWAKLNLQSIHDKAQVYRAWADIIEAYSGTSLTRPTDKLVAISGLAHRVWDKVRDDYCAGFWKNGLEDHLVWRRRWGSVSTISFNYDMRSKNTSTSEFVAPSWSWASLECAVQLPTEFEKSEYRYSDIATRMMTVDSIYIDLSDRESPFGAIKSGALNVRGRLGRVKFDLASPEELKQTMKMLFNDFQSYTGLPGRDAEFNAALNKKIEKLLESWREEGINELYFLPTRFKPDYYVGSEPKRLEITYQGLVLRKSPRCADVFSRVGFFDFKYCVEKVYDWWMELFDDFDRDRKSHGLRYAPHSQAGFTYRITII